MKKFLSLVLALVMTMSLVTVSAGAKDFSDDGSITYQEAVDVISEIGVVDGYTGGDFKPTDVLTRGAAAKIICNLILGPTTASALAASTAPASTMMTIRQLGAKGPFVDTLLQVVALDDVVGLIAYSVAISVALARDAIVTPAAWDVLRAAGVEIVKE